MPLSHCKCLIVLISALLIGGPAASENLPQRSMRPQGVIVQGAWASGPATRTKIARLAPKAKIVAVDDRTIRQACRFQAGVCILR
ncbi:hypothetical protein [Rhizobium paknamense]|uniref:S1-C subfamily serine protease n=1 Tax=Rhizobium paknamense TaxID=1206817 RepID=A0ABU0IEG6_9HYPH|nr:hypothetical protein [Rhizobium paknamense]MDQ0456632.1 S1-C subfamily serine protease [Rhizobium paknamense]